MSARSRICALCTVSSEVKMDAFQSVHHLNSLTGSSSRRRKLAEKETTRWDVSRTADRRHAPAACRQTMASLMSALSGHPSSADRTADSMTT